MDFVVALPPGWVRIPLDGREKARAAALAAAKTSSLTQLDRQAAQQKLTKVIRDALSQAYTLGGTDILLSLADLNGVPLVASCLVTYAEHHKPVSLSDLENELRKHGNGGVTAPKVAGYPAVRHHYIEDLMTRTDFHTRVPGRAGLITFAFSAPAGPLADAMAELFDAMAATLRWRS
jgi:hypothetical protein